MLHVGITGGIGSGKSLVVKIFNALGVPCYNADNRARLICNTSAEVKAQILHHFGAETYLSDGSYNTRLMATIVFNNPEKLQLLNSIVHPAVAKDYNEWATLQNAKGLQYVLKEAALLFEAGTYLAMDKMITVVAPLALRIDRILSRDIHRTKSDIEQIIANQWPDQDKILKSDFVLYNDEKQGLITQVLNTHQSLVGVGNK